MAKKARRDKVPNQCVDHDVRLPTVRPAPKKPTSALDLSDQQVYLLAEHAARQGGRPADRCRTLFGFDPTAEDAAHVEWVCEINAAAWKDQLDIARDGWGAWFERRYGVRPPAPVSLTPERAA